MFCIKCGKPVMRTRRGATASDFGTFCEEHFLESRKLFETSNFIIRVCDGCGSYFDGEWKEQDDIANAAKEMIADSIVTENKIKKIDIHLKKFGNKFLATVTCTGTIKPCKKQKMETSKIIVTMKRQKCDNCVKLLGNYYEAVIQVRGERKGEIFKIIEAVCGKMALRCEAEKNGYNLYFVRKNEARKVAKNLGRKYDVKASFKFAAEKKGKKLYRNYYSVR